MIEKTDRPFDLKICADIWLAASVAAHTFMEPGFWASSHRAMHEEYLPASEVYIARKQPETAGFAAIRNDWLAALFVDPEEWGKGVGSRLLCHAKGLHKSLELSVYTVNARAVAFYQKHDFFIQNEQICPHTGAPELLMFWHRG